MTPGWTAHRASIPAGPTSSSPTARSTSSRSRSAVWQFNPATGYPVGVSDNNGRPHFCAGHEFGIYQKLSTRAGGEVVSSDQY